MHVLVEDLLAYRNAQIAVLRLQLRHLQPAAAKQLFPQTIGSSIIVAWARS